MSCPDAQPTVLQVVDSCPSCPATGITVPSSTFSHYLAPVDLGNVSVSFQQVPCLPCSALCARPSRTPSAQVRARAECARLSLLWRKCT